jgi:flavin-dependent dehydrogenase
LFITDLSPSGYVDRELRRFFARRSYRGAVVTVSRLNQGEFVALLGDAAHSVLPATGEGERSSIFSQLEPFVVLFFAVFI